MKKTSLLLILCSFLLLSTTYAADSPKPILIATHALSYNFEKHGNEFYPVGPIIMEASKSKSDSIASLDQIVLSPSSEYQKLKVLMIKMGSDISKRIVAEKQYNIPQHRQIILDLHSSWDISNKEPGRYLFVLLADNDIISAFPFSINE